MTSSDTRLAGAVNKIPVMAMFPLSGYTHGGQIWPFDYLVKTCYPFLERQYKIKNMNLIVTRGADTWGPRMRLWYPGEILRITLHSKKK